MGHGPEPGDTVMLEVGRIDRPHGLGGELVVSLVTTRTERLAPGSVLTTARGPLTVRSSRPHQHRHLVSFEEVQDRDAAELWRGETLSAPAPEEPDDGTLWVHDLVGAAVFDQGGRRRGSVVAVVENPASDLLELDDGSLVPAVFVVGHVPGTRIDVEVPDGLFGDGEA